MSDLKKTVKMNVSSLSESKRPGDAKCADLCIEAALLEMEFELKNPSNKAYRIAHHDDGSNRTEIWLRRLEVGGDGYPESVSRGKISKIRDKIMSEIFQDVVSLKMTHTILKEKIDISPDMSFILVSDNENGRITWCRGLSYDGSPVYTSKYELFNNESMIKITWLTPGTLSILDT